MGGPIRWAVRSPRSRRALHCVANPCSFRIVMELNFSPHHYQHISTRFWGAFPPSFSARSPTFCARLISRANLAISRGLVTVSEWAAGGPGQPQEAWPSQPEAPTLGSGAMRYSHTATELVA